MSTTDNTHDMGGKPIFGSHEMREPAPSEFIPKHGTPAETAYQLVKDETEYPRVAVMCGRCINMVANMWNTPEKEDWKTGAVGIGSSEA